MCNAMLAYLEYAWQLDPCTHAANENQATAEWWDGWKLFCADNHPNNIWVFSSQRAHMIYHNYKWQQARGRIHLFRIEEVLRARGESWVA